MNNMIAAAGVMRIALKRADDERAGQVGAEDGEQKEFSFGLDVCKFRQISAQMPFGKQIRKDGRYAARDRTQGCDEPARATLERQAEDRAVRVVDVILRECKDLAFAGQTVDDTDLPPVQAHGERIEGFCIKLHLCAPAFSARRRRHHREGVRHFRPAGRVGDDHG